MSNGSYYPADPWSSTSPFQDQRVAEFFDEFDPASRFDGFSPTGSVPWVGSGAAPVWGAPGGRDVWRDVDEPPAVAATEPPQVWSDAPIHQSPLSDGPGGSSGAGRMHGHPIHCEGGGCRAPVQPLVFPMARGVDGVFRTHIEPSMYFGYQSPQRTPASGLPWSPYMNVPVTSSFGIKEEGCGCTSCSGGGSCR